MNVRGMRADATALLRGWARSKAGPIITVAMPLVLLLAFGFIFSPEAPERPLVIVEDVAGNPAAGRFIAALEAEGSIAVARGAIPSGVDAASWLRDAGATGLAAIPAGFGTDPNATVRLVVDPSESAKAAIVRNAIEVAALRYENRSASTFLQIQETAPLAIAPYPAFLLAGVLGLTSMLVGLSLGYHSLSELRHAGLLERLAVSPLTKREWLFARMAATALIGLGTAAVLVIVALVAFPAPPHGSLATVLLVLGGTLVFSGLGTLLGLAVKDPQAGAVVLNLALLPMVILSGAFFPLSRLPEVLQWAAVLSPLTHLNNGLRADLLDGDVTLAFLHAGALLLGSVLLLVAGGRLTRWTHER